MLNSKIVQKDKDIILGAHREKFDKVEQLAQKIIKRKQTDDALRKQLKAKDRTLEPTKCEEEPKFHSRFEGVKSGEDQGSINICG